MVAAASSRTAPFLPGSHQRPTLRTSGSLGCVGRFDRGGVVDHVQRRQLAVDRVQRRARGFCSGRQPHRRAGSRPDCVGPAMPTRSEDRCPEQRATRSARRNGRRPRPDTHRAGPQPARAGSDAGCQHSSPAPGSPACRCPDRARRLSETIQSSGSCVQTSSLRPHSARCAASGSGPNPTSRQSTPCSLQAARDVDGVAPDAAHRIERDQHPAQHASSRTANGNGRWCWMSLKSWKVRR